MPSQSQTDSVHFNEVSSHMFPSIPIKSSFTNIIDQREDQHYLYSANMEAGLGIYDISQETIIDLVMNVNISSFDQLDVSALYQRGNRLYVGIGDFQTNSNPASGLAIVDISDPESPVVVDIWDSAAFSHGIAHVLVEGNTAYLSTMSDGIILLDITNEDDVAFLAHLELDMAFPSTSNNAHNARGLALTGSTLLVCMDRGGLRAVNVSTPSAPVEVKKYINTSLNTQAAAAYNDVLIIGDYAVVSVDYCGVEVIDISGTTYTSVQWYNPWDCGFTNWSGADLHANELAFRASDSVLFVTGGQSEVFAFDARDLQNLPLIGSVENVDDSLAVHGLDVLGETVMLSFIHTPIHIPPFTPFYSDPGGLKRYDCPLRNLTGIASFEPEGHASISIFPNPSASGIVTVVSHESMHRLQVVNSHGQLVYQSAPIRLNRCDLNLGDLTNGCYIVMVQDGIGQHAVRLVLQR